MAEIDNWIKEQLEKDQGNGLRKDRLLPFLFLKIKIIL
jgi:hypothetical protein